MRAGEWEKGRFAAEKDIHHSTFDIQQLIRCGLLSILGIVNWILSKGRSILRCGLLSILGIVNLVCRRLICYPGCGLLSILGIVN